MRYGLCPALISVILSACAPEAAPRKQSEAIKHLSTPDAYRVKLETSKGAMVIEVRKEWSPRAAERFYELVNAHYYDGTRFHRVIRGFVAQFGIHPDPKQGHLWRDLRFPDEPVKLSNKRGTVAFAHSGPHTRAVQVFLNLRDNPTLDKQSFPAFGKVVEGMDVADRLAFLYGELAPRGSGPDGVKAELEGNAYMERQFPRLDYIRTARVAPQLTAYP
ncbi:MAG TPA: peptidylprolyl isomerase [Bryobacteraceae bacterium]|nr:peptidylprolyl isomerase [Bryobacteraceae bacterium]